MLWNAGQFGRQFFGLNDLLKPMAKIANLGDVNITFKPDQQPGRQPAPRAEPGQRSCGRAEPSTQPTAVHRATTSQGRARPAEPEHRGLRAEPTEPPTCMDARDLGRGWPSVSWWCWPVGLVNRLPPLGWLCRGFVELAGAAAVD